MLRNAKQNKQTNKQTNKKSLFCNEFDPSTLSVHPLEIVMSNWLSFSLRRQDASDKEQLHHEVPTWSGTRKVDCQSSL